MTKPELGTKRLCAKCSARYYDLNKTAITCPKCGTPFEVVATTTQKRSGQRAVVSQPEVEPEEAASATKVISLEEVETEDVETNEAEENAKDDSEDTLIEEVEEEDTDVSEIQRRRRGQRGYLKDRPRPKHATRRGRGCCRAHCCLVKAPSNDGRRIGGIANLEPRFMRSNQNTHWAAGRNGGYNPNSKFYESNGPDVKIRGTAANGDQSRV